MFKNQKLYDQWKIIFKKPINDELCNIIDTLNINNLQDLFKRFKNSYLKNQNDIDSYELVKLLLCLEESEDNILDIYQTLLRQGMISIDHLKIATTQDFQNLGLMGKKQKLIEQEIIYFSIKNNEFYQMVDLFIDDGIQPFQTHSQLIEMGIGSIESLLQLTTDQVDQMGLNILKFIIQNNIYSLKQKGLNINNIIYPFKKYQYKYFPQTNILIYGEQQNYKTWIVEQEQLIENYDLEEFINQFDQVLFIKTYDIIIGIYNYSCQIIHLQKQSISYSTKLYRSLKNQLGNTLKGCQSKLQNILCFCSVICDECDKIYLWSIKQDKQQTQLFLKSNVSFLEQKKYIMMVKSKLSYTQYYLLVQISKRYKLFRRFRYEGYQSLQSFSGRYFIVNQHTVRQYAQQTEQTLGSKHYVIDITNITVKQIIHNFDQNCADQMQIESLNIFIQLFKDKIKIYNREYLLINETVNPYRKLHNTCPQKLEYDQKHGLIIFQDR